MNNYPNLEERYGETAVDFMKREMKLINTIEDNLIYKSKNIRKMLKQLNKEVGK